MKRILLTSLSLLLMGLCVSSCGNSDANNQVITKRIQYDVTIKSPDASMDWWVQNLEGAARESLIRDIMSAAYEGQVKVWDVFHQEMSLEQLRSMGNRTDTLTFQRPDPPYDLYDTVVRQALSLAEISRFRFLESWEMDTKSLKISKDVIGICPLKESYAPDGSLRGYMPLFWIYFDPKYPGAFQVPLP